MGKKLDLIGQKFRNLTVIEESGKNKWREIMWLCKCSCGKKNCNKETIVSGGNLRRYNTKSCGCSHRPDLTGQKFGRLTVIKKSGKNKNYITYLCQCKCGKKTIAISTKLIQGRKKSCGCLEKENIIALGKSKKTHGLRHTRFYNIWCKMKRRGLGKENRKNYYNKGIRICERWLKFENFRDDMYNSYLNHVQKHGESQTTIDRTNNKGIYELSNCAWRTYKEQGNNTSTNHLITFKGKTQNISQWADELNIGRCTLLNRIKCGWSLEKALSSKKYINQFK